MHIRVFWRIMKTLLQAQKSKKFKLRSHPQIQNFNYIFDGKIHVNIYEKKSIWIKAYIRIDIIFLLIWTLVIPIKESREMIFLFHYPL